MKQYRSNDNQVIVRGSGNYASDEAKEIAKLKKELKDTKDALEVLKKAIGIRPSKAAWNLRSGWSTKEKRSNHFRSQWLKTIGVSRSGFYSYKKNENLLTQTQIRNEHL